MLEKRKNRTGKAQNCSTVRFSVSATGGLLLVTPRPLLKWQRVALCRSDRLSREMEPCVRERAAGSGWRGLDGL